MKRKNRKNFVRIMAIRGCGARSVVNFVLYESERFSLCFCRARMYFRVRLLSFRFIYISLQRYTIHNVPLTLFLSLSSAKTNLYNTERVGVM